MWQPIEVGILIGSIWFFVEIDFNECDQSKILCKQNLGNNFRRKTLCQILIRNTVKIWFLIKFLYYSRRSIANGDDFHRALFWDPQQSKWIYSNVWSVKNLAYRGRQGRASQWLAFDPSDIFEGWEIFSKSWEYQLHHHTLFTILILMKQHAATAKKMPLFIWLQQND